ncbi:MAG: NACHT domain-containing protein, partial [Actinomycetota bacterium]|nr:NACHT domain-containing protein [Actinomycetota bacterium]
MAQAKDILTMLMTQQWRRESHLRALDDPDPIPVQWRPTGRDEVIDLIDNRTPGVFTQASSADVVAMANDFRRMKRKRLIILGKGGAGKTTLAVQLLLVLLATRQGQADEPVPVLLSLTGWDTSRYERLQEWLADRIAHEYPELSTAGYGPQVLKTLTEQGHILPILDGLDEVTTSEQAKIIAALNRSLTADDQLILTSRTEEFEEAVRAAGRVLISAEVIEPELLTPSAAADYLQ